MKTVALLLALVPAAASGATPTVPPALAPVAFLIGDWTGAGSSDAGTGKGTDTFHLDLGGRAIVRRSQAIYEAKDGKPGGTYSSMMVIYATADGTRIRAEYFDSGGHVIHYTLAPGTTPGVAQFVSDPTPAEPSFRLTYTDAADDRTMHVTFELAAPGSSTFSTTIADGTDTRR